MREKINLAVFASGKGSNFEALLAHFKNESKIRISLLVCNKVGAGAVQLAKNHNIPIRMMDRTDCIDPQSLLNDLKKQKVGFLILAGFLWKIPDLLIEKYRGRIINIHPALLPKYGGKGMYGHRVHEAVLANKEKVSGITIHQVDEEYDHGASIFQASCDIEENETVDSLANKIHQLEHRYFPSIIEEFIKKQTTS